MGLLREDWPLCLAPPAPEAFLRVEHALRMHLQVIVVHCDSLFKSHQREKEFLLSSHCYTITHILQVYEPDNPALLSSVLGNVGLCATSSLWKRKFHLRIWLCALFIFEYGIVL